MIHKIPHKTTRLLLEVTNIQGELKLPVSLKVLLGFDNAKEQASSSGSKVCPRMLVLATNKNDFVFLVDEVYGLAPVDLSRLEKVPLNLKKLLSGFTVDLFHFKNKTVGLLEEGLLIESINNNHL